MKINKIILMFFIFSTMFGEKLEDIIYLKDGTIVKGTIIDTKLNEYYKIKSGDNVFVFEIDTIDSIQKKSEDKTKVSRQFTILEKGSRSFDGNFSYSEGKSDHYENDFIVEDSFFSIMSSYEFFVKNNLSLGMNFAYYKHDTDNYQYYDYETKSNSVGFGMRYYLGDNLVYIGTSILKQKTNHLSIELFDGTSFERKTDGIEYHTSIGKLFNITNNFYLDFGFRYQKESSKERHIHYEANGEVNSHSIAAEMNPINYIIYVGFKIFFPKKKN